MTLELADTTDPHALGLRAFVWGYPLVRAAQLRINLTRPDDPCAARPPTVAGAPINSMGHARVLATPQTRVGVAPNNDTLYSIAWLDLDAGPFVLEGPDFGNRYYTFQMGQADSSTDRSIGQRTHGGRLPPILIVGPGHPGDVPPGMERVRSHHRYLMVAGRILVDGPADLVAVHALQDQVRLRPWSAWQAGIAGLTVVPAQRPLTVFTPSADDGLGFLEQLGVVLGDLTLSPQETGIVESLRCIGLVPGTGFHKESLTAKACAALAAGLREGEALVRSKTLDLGRKVNGWSINDRGSRFGEDYLLRAAVAMDQIYIVEPEEALYPSARIDASGQALDGRHHYRLRFPLGTLPPVRAFWSITIYYAKGFMVPNPINRWAIGDRTPGLVLAPDGSLDILLQPAPPAGAMAANWLPTPKEAFMLLMRLYHPQAQALNGQWVPPAIERIGP